MKIVEAMTPFPHTIGAEQSVARAEEMMNEYGVRHLPVLNGGKLQGIITSRDILLMKSFPDVDINKTKILESSTMDPYQVSPSADIAEVCSEMSENKYSCAIVTESDKVVGIFSWVDALKVLADKARSG